MVRTFAVINTSRMDKLGNSILKCENEIVDILAQLDRQLLEGENIVYLYRVSFLKLTKYRD
jgi:hypothetical protein